MRKLFLFTLSVVIFSSCGEKEKNLEPAVDSSKLTTRDVTIKNDILKFTSQEHLKNVIREISNNKEMENWYPDLDFVSLLKRQKSISREKYDQISQTGEFGELSDVLTFRGEGDDKILGEIVKIPALSAVLNAKSYVIVADTIYHIGVDQVTSIYIGDDINNLSGFLKDRSISGTRTVEIERKPLNNARMQGEFRRTEGNRRLFASNQIISFGGLGEYREVYVEYLKKNWIGWSRTSAPYLSITATAWSAPFGGQQYSRTVEGWSVEVIGFSSSETIFGSSVYYNFNAHLKCTVFDGDKNVEADF